MTQNVFFLSYISKKEKYFITLTSSPLPLSSSSMMVISLCFPSFFQRHPDVHCAEFDFSFFLALLTGRGMLGILLTLTEHVAMSTH